MAKFSVDTHLFRELGELLVGRDSTALVELIKNAYDADASQAIIYGEALGDLERGIIRIIDSGVGMDRQAFESGFLRIASRTKDSGDRLSRRYRRRYTGAKGIGRLAAHKLARSVEIDSVPWREEHGNAVEAIYAVIDWDAIEQKETLDDVETILDSEPAGPERKEGTTITLRRLRRPWTDAERGRFLAEVQTFEPPQVLVKPLAETVLEKPLLFETPQARDSSDRDPGFRVVLEGEFAAGDEYWARVAETAEWVIEIEALRGSDVEFAIAPTQKMLRENPAARPYRYRKAHPDPNDGPFFQARILVREGQLKMSPAIKEWAKRAAGIRVFMEGFRVLPYGEPGNDWLSIDADYTRRQRSLPWLEDEEAGEKASVDEGLSFLPSWQYFGAVFLTEEGARSLRMLVNREGFVPEAGFDNLVSLLRLGLDLSVRVRAASKARRKQVQAEPLPSLGSNGSSAEPKRANAMEFDSSVDRAVFALSEARQAASRGQSEEAFRQIDAAQKAIASATKLAKQIMTDGAMLRVLASVGTQMAAFVHELNGLVSMAQSIDRTFGRLRDGTPAAGTKVEMAKLHGVVGDLKRALERQASYLIDVVTPDARRRRTRQSLAERFEAGRRLVEQTAGKRRIAIINEIPEALKSPPMYPAELTTVFSNLLTNAVKAAGEGGKVRACATQLQGGKVQLVLENTGASVNPDESERWFKPFESTTVEVDAVLGQGMGLGLPITRNMLEEYGAEIHFVKPSQGFATAIEIVFPK